jgi:transcriptional regulator with XRE-family HTH domain
MTSDAVVSGRTYQFGLHDRLRIAREQSGLGQREFAQASGISRSSVANYENGNTRPRRPQLIAWAMATGFSLEWLETGIINRQPVGPDRGGVPPTPEYGQFHRLQVTGVAANLSNRRAVADLPLRCVSSAAA